jgi:TldD protein
LVAAAPPALTDKDLAELAIQTLRGRGADYGDIRVCRYRYQEIYAENRSFKRLVDTEHSGFGIRVLHNGAWGFAASQVLDEAAVRQMAEMALDIAKASGTLHRQPVSLVPAEVHRAEWTNEYKVDPFVIPLDHKTELVMGVSEKMQSVKNITRTEAGLNFDKERKLFASTEGSLIQQTIIRSEPFYRAYATTGGDTQSRGFENYPLNIGFEHILECGYLENAERVANEAVEKVRAADGPTGVHKDLVLSPSHLWLTIHESVGHPTELDRVLGYEANYAGTSFATPEKLGTLRYGSELVNLVADRTTRHARSTVGYDDEGVKATSWDIVRKGTLVGYATNRETAARLGLPHSTACAHADSWRSVPLIRIPNISLQPGGADAPTLEDLIADTREGILIDGSGSYSIDQQRRNFQFGGDAFWEIRNGQRTRMLKNVTYHSMTTDFWGACDAVGNQAEFRLYGTRFCGKGEPSQSGQMSTGAPPARFRGVEVGGGAA